MYMHFFCVYIYVCVNEYIYSCVCEVCVIVICNWRPFTKFPCPRHFHWRGNLFGQYQGSSEAISGYCLLNGVWEAISQSLLPLIKEYTLHTSVETIVEPQQQVRGTMYPNYMFVEASSNPLDNVVLTQ